MCFDLVRWAGKGGTKNKKIKKFRLHNPQSAHLCCVCLRTVSKLTKLLGECFGVRENEKQIQCLPIQLVSTL